MRHLRSLSYALVLAPTTWTLSAVAFTQELTGRARTEGSIEVFTGFVLLLLAGAAYAILLLPRFSPVGPVATGALFLAVCVWVLIDAASFEGLFPAGVRKPGFDLTLPAHGLAALLAVPLLCTALSRRRWRESRFEPVDANTGTIIWPFARPARPGTLVVPGVTGVPASDATQVLHLGTPTEALPGSADRTQVVGDLSADATTRPVPLPGDATQVIPPPAEATQTLPPTATATQPPTTDATQTLPPTATATQPPTTDATQALPPAGGGAEPAPPVKPAPPLAGATASGSTGTGTGEAGPGGPLPADEDADTQLVPPPATPSAAPETPREPGVAQASETRPAGSPVGGGAAVAGAERPADKSADEPTEESADDTTRLPEARPPAAPAPRRQAPDDTDVTRAL